MKEEHNGYTAFPHTFADGLMPLVGGSEWKVFHVVVRGTLGWRKVWDAIAISQFASKTGMTRQSVFSALAKADEHGIIQKREVNRQRIEYALSYPDMEQAEQLVKKFNELSGKEFLPLLSKLVKLLDESYEKLVKNLDTQKKESKDIKKKKAEIVVPISEKSGSAYPQELLDRPEWDLDLQHEAFKLGMWIRGVYDCCHPNIESDMRLLQKLLAYEQSAVKEKITEAKQQMMGRGTLEWTLEQMGT